MKIVVKIFNFIYMALAAVACFCLATKPIINLDITVGLPADLMSNVLPLSDLGMTKEEFVEIVGSDGLPVRLSFQYSSTVAFKLDGGESIKNELEKELDTSISNAVTELEAPLNNIIKSIAKTTAGNAIYQGIKDELGSILNGYDPETSDGDAILTEYGIDDEFISEFTDDLWDSLLPDEDGNPANISDVMDVVEDYINEILEKLSASPDYKGEGTEFPPEMIDGIEETLQGALESFGLCDEEGNIRDINEALAILLQTMLNKNEEGGEEHPEHPEEEPEEEPGEEPGEEPESKLVLKEEPPEEPEEEESVSVSEVLTDFIKSQINLDVITENGVIVQYVYLGLVCLNMVPWALFFLITLIRTIRPRKCWTKPWIVFVFAFSQLVLAAITVVIQFVLPMVIPTIQGLIPAEYAGLLTGVALKLEFSAFIPGLIYAGMIVLTIVYAILCHPVKKAYKKYKKEKKAAKLAA